MSIANSAEYKIFKVSGGLSDHTLRRIHATISALYTWLASPEIGLVTNNPVSAVPAPKLTKKAVETLTHEQIQRLLDATDRARLPRRARALVLFLLDSGTRVSEAANVKLNDVDIKTGKIKVLGKGKKERFVYIGKLARSALWLYISNERPEPARPTDDHLFLSADGYPLDRHSMRHIIRRLSQWSGVKANPHLFRHTAAIERLRHGMDAFTLQKFLGHTTLDMTRKYLTALADEDIEVQAKRTSPADIWKLSA
jgi:integrase/recombinase XerD